MPFLTGDLEMASEFVLFSISKMFSGISFRMLDMLWNEKTFKDSGMKVIIAENGKLAIEKLEQEKDVEIVLMDVMMPVMDGYEAIERIRKYPEFKKTFLLFL